MTKRALFVCNTPYQVLVASWIKYNYINGYDADVIVSDHMNNGAVIAKSIEKTNLFSKVYYACTREYCNKDKYRKDLYSANRIRRLLQFHPGKYLSRYVEIKYNYTELYIANIDSFTQLLFHVFSKKSHRKCNLFLFEDGISTYSNLMKKLYYNSCTPTMDIIHRYFYKHIFKIDCVFGNIKSALLFNPDMFIWDADFQLTPIDKIPLSDNDFKKICNRIFNYSKDDDYSKKYIFFEESYYIDGLKSINDLKIVEDIAKIVKKENILVKIHPRNPINRFKQKGFLTSVNSYIPWEVILMNIEKPENKVFITIASSCVLNSFFLFGIKTPTLSIFNLLDGYSKDCISNNSLWDYIKNIYENNSDIFHICDSVFEVLKY